MTLLLEFLTLWALCGLALTLLWAWQAGHAEIVPAREGEPGSGITTRAGEVAAELPATSPARHDEKARP